VTIDPNDTREKAEADTVKCEYCDRAGLVTIYHPDYTGDPVVEVIGRDGKPHRQAGRVNAHCVCPVGRWMRRHTTDDLVRRIPDLNDVISRRIGYTLKDPTAVQVDENVDGLKPMQVAAIVGRVTGVKPAVVTKVKPPFVTRPQDDPIVRRELQKQGRLREPGDDDD
jgi:hypothetical protein